jgi:hypothetical protein
MVMNRTYELAIVTVLLLAFSVLALMQAAHISAVFEEPVITATGYYKLKTGDFSLDSTHPALNYELAALPMLITNTPFAFYSPDCQSKLFWQCTNDFFDELQKSGTNIDLLFFMSRLSHIIVGVLLGITIYIWTRKLYGTNSALLATALYSFSPTFISFAGLATQTIILAFLVVLNAYLFWQLTKKPTFLRLSLVSLTFGLALATEYTAILLSIIYIPFFTFSFFSKNPGFYERLFKKPRSFLNRARSDTIAGLIITAILFVVFLVVYQGQFTPLSESVPPHYVEQATEKLSNTPFSGLAPTIINEIPVPFSSYISGFAWQFIQTTGDFKANFFAGQIHYGTSIIHNITYFATNTFFKTPIPLMLLFVAGLFASLKGRRKILKSGEWILFLLPASFLFLVLNSSRNEGPLHILPVFAFMIIIAARSLQLFKPKRHTVITTALVILLAWYVVGTVIVTPHQISYFNELLPDDKAYKMYSDHSNDMGQELKHLKTYMDDNNIQSIKLSYFGSINPNIYGINYEYLPSPRFQPWIPNPIFNDNTQPEVCTATTGTVAISITNLNGVHLVNPKCYDWLKQYEPVANIGGAMLVYEVSK